MAWVNKIAGWWRSWEQVFAVAIALFWPDFLQEIKVSQNLQRLSSEHFGPPHRLIWLLLWL
jgi:hypothetical protein